ncbi:hypothetical protein EYF80_049870 [Liparis tanakae]|uniref:Uncharacterized protein n=1 Tax=Liparis tanakae TaxID=230148 RepID=A0A4Z2FGR4_9TELE|nr:hypothetical protein EYF80_049870 [Liparis tanakae]
MRSAFEAGGTEKDTRPLGRRPGPGQRLDAGSRGQGVRTSFRHSQMSTTSSDTFMIAPSEATSESAWDPAVGPQESPAKPSER